MDATVAASEMLFLDETFRLFYVNPTQVGSWQFQISYGLLNYPSVAHTAPIILDLTVFDACLDTEIADWSLSIDYLDLLVGDGSTTVILEEPTDSVSFIYGAQNGYDSCGSRMIFVVDQNGEEVDTTNPQGILYYSDRTLQINTPTEEGNYVYSIAFFLADYT